MIGGILHQQLVPIEEIMPYAPYMSYPAGLKDSDKAIFRYALNSSSFPNLIIVEPIYDNEGNSIAPGYYGLVLSDDRQFLILAQGDKAIASFPVFKFEEDRIALEKLKDKKYLKEQAKKAKAQAKVDAKRAKRGVPPEEKEVYMNATMDYHKDGDYYLIKYERDRIRAWGAIKR